MNAGVLQHFDDSFVRDDFVRIILDSSWPQRKPNWADPRPKYFFFASSWACVHFADVDYVPGVQTSLPE